LRQRVEAKLAAVLFQRNEYGAALALVDGLLVELKKLDDKQLLVETHLVESRINHGLRNVAKAKAALTASRTAANAIYVAPSLQASIDSMSGVLHCEEADYDTAHSYFLESFEQLDQMDDRERAVPCLKYMMLCKILDSLGKALKLSAMGAKGKSSSTVDIGSIISGRQGVKYAGRDIEAMSAIAKAAEKRSLKEFDETSEKYSVELESDLLIKHHLNVLKEQILESNLVNDVISLSAESRKNVKVVGLSHHDVDFIFLVPLADPHRGAVFVCGN
jgi:26S proteasome regulatory subunit N6